MEFAVSETVKERLTNYTMKMQLYPTQKQAEKIDKILRALQLAYNITFHEVFSLNPDVCKTPDKNGLIWPDFKKIAKKEWKETLIQQNSAIKEAPAAALTTKLGLFLTDASKAWKTGMHNLPINRANRKDFHFYNSAHPRRSFTVQVNAQRLRPSLNNPKVLWVSLPLITVEIKARGFNRKIFFGKDGNHTFEEALVAGELASLLTIRVSKDTCGDYFLSVIFSESPDCNHYLYREIPSRSNPTPIGLDVGIKDIAILSNGTKYKNQHFKTKKKKALVKMSRQFSRKWGPANQAFRDYNKAIRAENRTNPNEKKSFAQPSHGYLKIQQNHARLERKIARQRNTYYHQVTAEIVRNANFIGTETLQVKNMMQNHKLAYALQDAAMSDFLSKLKYKTERSHIPIVPIGMFEPSSQLCSSCGEKNLKVKNLNIRTWICPHCGAKHDRDINAAKNILQIAQENKPCQDTAADIPSKTHHSRKNIPRKSHENRISDDFPELIIQFSKELTHINAPRYIIVNKKTNQVVDDAQGHGYRTIHNARNCYLAKVKYAKSH